MAGDREGSGESDADPSTDPPDGSDDDRPVPGKDEVGGGTGDEGEPPGREDPDGPDGGDGDPRPAGADGGEPEDDQGIVKEKGEWEVGESDDGRDPEDGESEGATGDLDPSTEGYWEAAAAAASEASRAEHAGEAEQLAEDGDADGGEGDDDDGDENGNGDTDGVGSGIDNEWARWLSGESIGEEREGGEEDGEEGADEVAETVETTEGTAVDRYEPADPVDRGVFGRGAPAEDREMPLTEHIEEMLRRLAVVIAVAGVVSVITFPFADRLINFLWYGILPGTEVARPRVYGILELKFTELKVASLAGLIVALPVMVYEAYQFMRPGLYPHERRYYLAAIPTSLVLALVGVSFAFFIVLPAIFTYFLYYSESVATIGFALMRTFDLILLLMGYLAVVFQIPLFIMLGILLGIVTRRWLADRRLIFWGVFLGISFLFSPDPTGMAPIIVALTMIVLFEGTLLLARWAGR